MKHPNGLGGLFEGKVAYNLIEKESHCGNLDALNSKDIFFNVQLEIKRVLEFLWSQNLKDILYAVLETLGSPAFNKEFHGRDRYVQQKIEKSPVLASILNFEKHKLKKLRSSDLQLRKASQLHRLLGAAHT